MTTRIILVLYLGEVQRTTSEKYHTGIAGAFKDKLLRVACLGERESGKGNTVKWKSLSRVWLFETLWIVHGILWPEYWSG